MAKRCCRIYDFLIIDATAPCFSCNSKLRSYEIKTLRADRTAAEMEMAPERPAAGGESCVAGSLFISGNQGGLQSFTQI